MIDNIEFIKRIENKVFDLRSEKLFREAEEEFHYNSNPKAAIEKLKEALKYSPFFSKAILFLGNILLKEKKIKEAIQIYKEAERVNLNDSKVCVCLANGYYLLEEYDLSLDYVNRGFECEKAPFGSVYKALFDLKSSILIRQKKYTEAKKTIENARYKLVSTDLEDLKAEKLRIIEQKTKIFKKIKEFNLKLVK